jgi:2-iminobutanoate/2-iminopropanoate deaminase
MSKRRRAIEITGVRHSAPIPMGARIDNVVWSSAIQGMDPSTGIVPDDGLEQVRFAFANLDSFLREADVTYDDIIRITVYLSEPALRDEVNRYWLELFPDEHDRPARHAMNMTLNNNMLVQLEVIAIRAA